MRDKVTGQCPQTTTFEEKREPKRIRTEVLLLTGTARPNRLTILKVKFKLLCPGMTGKERWWRRGLPVPVPRELALDTVAADSDRIPGPGPGQRSH